MTPRNTTLTVIGGIVTLVVGGYYMLRTTESSLRESVVANASKEVGYSSANKYWADVLPNTKQYPPSWCGAFALWALHKAGLAKDVNWKVGLGFLYTLPITKSPKIGDVAYFTTNQHHAVVKSVNTDGTVTLINGNGEGGKVSLSKKPVVQVTAFYSIQPFIDKVLNV